MTLAWGVRQYKFLKSGTPASRSERQEARGRTRSVERYVQNTRGLPRERKMAMRRHDRAS